MTGRGRAKGGETAPKRRKVVADSAADTVLSLSGPQPGTPQGNGSAPEVATPQRESELGSASPSRVPETVLDDNGTNANLLKKVAAAKATLTNHSLFNDITQKEAISAGMAVWQKNDMKAKLASIKNYTAAFNLFQVCDLGDFLTKDTPVHLKKVQQLGDHFWSTPPENGLCPYTIVLACPSSLATDGNVTQLAMLSPPEYAWAFLFAIEEGIDASMDDADMEKFQKAALAFSVRLEVIDNHQDRLWRAHQLRQSDSQVGYVAKQTPVQCMFSVMATKKLLEKSEGRELSPEATALAWQKT